MDTATKTETDAKTADKKVVQNTSEATGDLIEHKIANKITSVKNKKWRKRRWSNWNRRNLHSTRKKAANYWCFKTVLEII